VAVLYHHRPKPVGRGVTLDDEHLGEVWHGEHRGGGDRGFEDAESLGRRLGPGETILLEERGERCGNGAVVVDELAIVSGQPEEAAHRPRRARHRPVLDGLHLSRVHGNACLGDDVAEVRDGGGAEGALDEELVVAKLGEDGA
jgi:hypothetical protein